jgi:hypothetical protein
MADEESGKSGDWRLKQGEVRCPKGMERDFVRPVGEEKRIEISTQLLEFRDSSEEEMQCAPNLSNHERAIIHQECRKYGFTSQSNGVGVERRITVYKPKAQEADSKVFPLPLSMASVSAIKQHFEQHPPTHDEIETAASGAAEAKTLFKKHDRSAPEGRHQKRQRAGPRALEASPGEVASLCQSYQARLQTKQGVSNLSEQRAKLPIAEFKEKICQQVRGNQVILLAGETGCGKTTQVPQYLLDDCWAQGKGCRILCTQPRMISCRTVSERVAAERGETVGGTVGYQVRTETVGGSASSLMFCTNNALLRRLTNSSAREELQETSHILIDEIHERDRYADFLLVVLKVRASRAFCWRVAGESGHKCNCDVLQSFRQGFVCRHKPM